MNPILEHNRRAWDKRVADRQWHSETATPQDFADPLAVLDECGWLGNGLAGRRVLCLAAGGGKHGPLFAKLGADVTVVDLSPEMLAQDRAMAAKYSLSIRTVEASMDSLTALGSGTFDLVIQPVSTCYVADVKPVFREVARVTAPNGLYISQHKQPSSLQATAEPVAGGYLVHESYDRTDALPAAVEGLGHREFGTLEFVHRWEDLLGELCRSGFVIEDVREPRHGSAAAAVGSFGHRCLYLPPFITFKARRAASDPGSRKLWTPGGDRREQAG